MKTLNFSKPVPRALWILATLALGPLGWAYWLIKLAKWMDSRPAYENAPHGF